MAVKLTDLVNYNKWWKGEGWEEEDLDLKKVRFLLKRRMIDISESELTIIRGVRRSGKTVYLKEIIRHLIEKGIDPRSIMYLSCDRMNRSRTRNIVNEFRIQRGGGYLILDEITYMEDWNLLLKEIMEQGSFTVIATGSNPVGIKHSAERLPGRGVEGNEYYFDPLSFREFLFAIKQAPEDLIDPSLRDAILSAPDIDHSFPPFSPDIDVILPFFEEIERLFHHYLLTGGFPNAIVELLLDGKVNTDTYEMIIRMTLGLISKEGRKESIARSIMERLNTIGTTRVDFQTIGKDVEAHHNTVRDYLDLLEDGRILYVLHQWDLAKRRIKHSKGKKMVFQSSLFPIAFNNYIKGGQWHQAQEFLDQNKEWLIEGVVASHVIWTLERPLMMEKHAFAGFHGGKKECDLVLVQGNDRLLGFETKYGKLKKTDYPFPVTYLTKEESDMDAIPVSLFLFGLKKGDWSV